MTDSQHDGVMIGNKMYDKYCQNCIVILVSNRSFLTKVILNIICQVTPLKLQTYSWDEIDKLFNPHIVSGKMYQLIFDLVDSNRFYEHWQRAQAEASPFVSFVQIVNPVKPPHSLSTSMDYTLYEPINPADLVSVIQRRFQHSYRHLRNQVNSACNQSVLKLIAKGGCQSVVQVVRNMLDENLYILKKVKQKEPSKDGVDKQEALREHQFHDFSIPNVLNYSLFPKIYECFYDDLYLYLVMTQAANGTLENWLHDIEQSDQQACVQEKLHICSQLFAGALLQHDANILHRDIKPENIFIGDGFTIMFGDFSVAEFLERESTILHKCSGTPGQQSWQMLKQQNQQFDTDIQSLNQVLQQVITRHRNFLIIDTVKNDCTYDDIVHMKIFKKEMALLQIVYKATFNDCQRMRVTALEICMIPIMGLMLRKSIRCKMTLCAIQNILRKKRMRKPIDIEQVKNQVKNLCDFCIKPYGDFLLDNPLTAQIIEKEKEINDRNLQSVVVKIYVNLAYRKQKFQRWANAMHYLLSRSEFEEFISTDEVKLDILLEHGYLVEAPKIGILTKIKASTLGQGKQLGQRDIIDHHFSQQEEKQYEFIIYRNGICNQPTVWENGVELKEKYTFEDANKTIIDIFELINTNRDKTWNLTHGLLFGNNKVYSFVLDLLEKIRSLENMDFVDIPKQSLYFLLIHLFQIMRFQQEIIDNFIQAEYYKLSWLSLLKNGNYQMKYQFFQNKEVIQISMIEIIKILRQVNYKRFTLQEQFDFWRLKRKFYFLNENMIFQKVYIEFIISNDISNKFVFLKQNEYNNWIQTLSESFYNSNIKFEFTNSFVKLSNSSLDTSQIKWIIINERIIDNLWNQGKDDISILVEYLNFKNLGEELVYQDLTQILIIQDSVYNKII